MELAIRPRTYADREPTRHGIPCVRLPLEGAYNVRELGGYPRMGGGVTQWGALLRSDGLGALTAADRDMLEAYGVVAVLDLRSAQELTQDPNPFRDHPRVRYRNVPFMPDEMMTSPDLTRANVADPYFLRTMYMMMLERSQDAVRRSFAYIAEQQDGCVLFHCAAGKDRTGVLSALLLGLAGVSSADILANYMVTYVYLRENTAMMAQSSAYPKEAMYSSIEYMEPMLDLIRTEYGGFEKYLIDAGVERAHIERVRERLAGG